MVYATKNEAVTKTEVIVIEPETYTLTLTRNEALALAALAGSTMDAEFWPANAPYTSLYKELKSAIGEDTYWNERGWVLINEGTLKYRPK